MRLCTNCQEEFCPTKKDTMRICKQCNTDRVKAQSDAAKMWRRAKSRAKERGLAFDIEKSDIKIPTHCPILNIELKCHSGSSGGKYNSPSLDKIIPELGYIKGNIQVISDRANKMKADASFLELKKFAEWINKLEIAGKN